MFFDNKARKVIACSATIAGTISILAFSISIHAVSAQTPQQVQQIAREVTVKIIAKPSGSGVIIGKQGSTYFVATASHVIPESKSEQYKIVTHDGVSYPVNITTIKRSSKDDLAVVSFVSDRNYRVATISNYLAATFQTRLSSSDKITFGEEINQQQTVFVSGFPQPITPNDPPNRYVFNPGKIIDTSGSAIAHPRSRAKGYRLSYTNLTQIGMSGGAVLDTNGRLIAIHGLADGQVIYGDRVVDQTIYQAEADKLFYTNFGTSLGIPITTFVNFLGTVAPQINLKIENTKPNSINADAIEVWIPSQQADQQINPIYWLNRGNQNWRLGNFKRSEEEFNQAILMKPEFWQAWYAKGFVAGFRQDFNQALKNCEKAIELTIKLNTDFYEGWRCKAGALYRSGNRSLLPKALEAMDRAIEINKTTKLQAGRRPSEWPENPNDYSERGEILYALGRPIEAIKAFDRAIEIEPEMSSAWSNRAFVQIGTEDFKGAEDAINRALAIDANYAPAWAQRGLLLNQQKQYVESIAAFDRAIQLSDRDPAFWLNRGVALYNGKRREEAIQSIRKALEIDPNYNPAIELLKQIK
jgi:tetratricopeptide (TPR) repeat protein